MFELEPGPLERLDERALQVFPPAPSFESILAEQRARLDETDRLLLSTKVTIGGDGAPDLDGAYETTIGVAEQTLAAQRGAADTTTEAELSDKADGADARRREAAPVLPDADSRIEGSFLDPPPPPSAGRSDDGDTQDGERD
jgi:hypothetical protein